MRNYYEEFKAIGTRASPCLHYLGVQLKELGEGHCSLTMPVKPEFLQGAGRVQGGIITVIADEAIAHSLMTLVKPGESISTIELKINFLSPVQEGELISEASIVKKGKRIALGEAAIMNSDGRLVAKAMATFLINSFSNSHDEVKEK